MTKLNEKYKINEQFRIKKSVCLDKSIFHSNNIRIIGQANNQIILCLLINEKLLLTFDQHAVHERIRYEKILESSFEKGCISGYQIKPPYEIKIPKTIQKQLTTNEILDKFQKYLNTQIIIKPDDNDNNDDDDESIVIVKQIPKCFNRNYHHSGSFQDFLIDAIKYFNKQQLSSNNNNYHMTPFLIEQIRTQACHGAIRFNETLTYYECKEMIKALTSCRSSFRCAHGRILVKLLLKIQNQNDDQDQDDEINFRKKIWEKYFQSTTTTIPTTIEIKYNKKIGVKII